MPIPFLMLPPQNEKTREWGRRLAADHPQLEIIVAETREGAEQAMPLAEGAYGTIPPDLLPKAQQLRWLQDRLAALRDEGAQPGLELFLDELVGGGDQGGVLDQAEWPGQPQPGTLMGFDLEVGELLQGPRPHLRQVRLAHRVFTSRPHMRINSLIHRLCTPHSAPCPGRRWTAVAGPRHPVPRGLAGCPQPRLAGRVAFGKRPFLPTARVCS